MGEINTEPKLTTLNDCLIYMSAQMDAMDRVEALIDQLDGDPGTNAIKDEEYRDQLIERYDQYAAEYNKGLAAFNKLSAQQFTSKRFLNRKSQAA